MGVRYFLVLPAVVAGRGERRHTMGGFRRYASLCAVIAVAATFAGSAGADDQGNGAVVINGAGCFVGRPYFPGGLIFTTNSHITLAPSGNGSTECHFQGIPNATGQTIVERGFPCSVAGQATTNNSTLVFTKSGNVEIMCAYNANGG